MLLPFCPRTAPFATALDAIVRRAQMPVADFNTHQRAQLVPDDNRLFYVERTLGQHRHKELRRYVRRLGDIGALLFTTATEPETVAGAIEDFFKLETRGWKGKAGTAAASHDDIRNFITAAVNGLATEGKVAINRIFIDGRAIAVTITLRSADTAWFWKIVYDEKFAQHSPGVVLTFAVTEDLVRMTLPEPNSNSISSSVSQKRPTKIFRNATLAAPFTRLVLRCMIVVSTATSSPAGCLPQP